MLDHIGLQVADLKRSRTFYDAALEPLGIRVLLAYGPEVTGKGGVCGYGEGRKPYFWLGEEPQVTGQVHVAFAAPDRPTVDAFYRAAMSAGGRDNGAPGVRPIYHPDYYGAFVLDPDGHNVEAVCHSPP